LTRVLALQETKGLFISEHPRPTRRGTADVGQGGLVGRCEKPRVAPASRERLVQHLPAFIRHGVARGRNGSSNHPAFDGTLAIGRHDPLPAPIAAGDDDQPTRSTPRSESHCNTNYERSIVMRRPPFEVADIVRTAGPQFRERYWRSLTWPQTKVLNAIVRCRTAALGGHRDQCDHCGYQAIWFNSCRNRHCPKCQTNARQN